MNESLEPQRFTDDEADELVGKTILIGVTYVDVDGQELQRSQMHGVVSSASARGVEVALRGERHGTTFGIPPDRRFFVSAAPGRYTLHGTGEVIEDPQLVCVMTATRERGH